jgi:hypothetical protein
MIALLAQLVGFTVGATVLGFVALDVGLALLRVVPGGIHGSGNVLSLLFGVLVCVVLGGVAGTKGAIRLVKSWRSSLPKSN